MDPEVERALGTLPDWTVTDGKLARTFEFPDFIAAFAFMTRVALLAEKADHHPEWSNVYGRVHVALCTHSAGGAITARDIDLARAIERVL